MTGEEIHKFNSDTHRAFTGFGLQILIFHNSKKYTVGRILGVIHPLFGLSEFSDLKPGEITIRMGRVLFRWINRVLFNNIPCYRFIRIGRMKTGGIYLLSSNLKPWGWFLRMRRVIQGCKDLIFSNLKPGNRFWWMGRMKRRCVDVHLNVTPFRVFQIAC